MSDSKISFHPTVGLDRGESRGCVAARCLYFFFFCLRDDLKLGGRSRRGEVKRYGVEGGEKGGERDTIRD